MTTSDLFPIFDGHNDALLRYRRGAEADGWSFLEEHDEGHLDLPRARRGGFAGGFFAIFTPPRRGTWSPTGSDFRRVGEGSYEVAMAPALEHAHARAFTEGLVEELRALERASGGGLVVVEEVDGLREALASERLAAVLHFEGAEAIDEELELLETYYGLGLRSLGLVWSRPNAFGHGVPFAYPRSPDIGPGLTEAGHRLVSACNDLGVLIDMAHLNERGFWDVAGRSERPLVVTHACVHAICPSARNLTDRQLDAIGESGGVVGINFFVGDLRADGILDDDTPLEQLARHIEYVADRIGIEHVAFGSDFDGARIPREMGDAAGLPRLVDTLRRRGFDDAALAAVTHRNWLRVLEETW